MNKKFHSFIALLPVISFLSGCGNQDVFYNIEWRNYDQTVLDTSVVKAGDTPTYKGDTPTREKDAQYTYSFDGWTPNISPASKDTIYVAKYKETTNQYTVTWKNYDGTVLDVESYNYGETPTYKGSTPTKEKDAQYTYTFSNWSPNITAVTKNTLYTAVYSKEINVYTVTWKNYDGTVLDVESYNYGEFPTFKGDTPTREKDAQYTYTFSNWSPNIKMVVQDTVYLAEYNNAVNSYLITWKNYDGSVLDIETYEYGELPHYKGTTPIKESQDKDYFYSFVGWDKKVVNVIEDNTYIAKFDFKYGYEIKLINNSYYEISKCYLTESEYISVPTMFNKLPIKTIKAESFANCKNAKSIIIPKSFLTIESEVFKGCELLESVTLPVIDRALINYFGVNYASLVPVSNVTITGGTSIPVSCFSGCSSLLSVSMPNTILSIYESAFAGCTSLSSITIPSGVSKISKSAFSGCSSLTSIIIPDSVTNIGDYAFYGCSSLTLINIPDGVTSIGEYAFFKCTSLSSITIPSGVSKISKSAFSGCSSLTSIIIPDGVKYIDKYAFAGCSLLKDVVVPDSVCSIGLGAFGGCNSLESITVPFIGDGTENNTYFGYIFGYEKYSSIVNETMPKNVTLSNACKIIKKNSFYGLNKIEKITFYGSVKTIESDAFFQCKSVQTSFIGSYEEWLALSGKSYLINVHLFLGGPASEATNVSVPSEATKVDSYAFYNCSSLTSISIPDSITKIESYAFYGCSSLTSITIPDNVTSIGASAFEGCSSLTSITIPDNVTSIGASAFRGCSSLRHIDIPNSITYLSTSLFEMCTSLVNITIPDSVNAIGWFVFRGCSSLKSIYIPDGVSIIYQATFQNCDSLEKISLPFIGHKLETSTIVYENVFGYIFGMLNLSGCTPKQYGEDPEKWTWQCCYTQQYLYEQYFSIPKSLRDVTIRNGNVKYHSFYNCSFLDSITILNSATNVDNYAFYNCSSLTSIIIPDSVTNIGDYAFNNCKSLTSIIIPDSVTNIGDYAFYGCSSLPIINIPDGVTSIGESAFANCASLSSIIIPNGVSEISKSAFSGCSSLTSITIPDSVTNIGDYAFSGCKSLTSITIPDSVTNIGNYAFNNCKSLTSIIIPDGVTSIGESAFAGCSSLSSITIPNGVSEISKSAFYYCSSLTSIIIPDSVTNIGYSAFYGCSSLTSITIPDSVEVLCGLSFGYCISLKTVLLGDNIRTIENIAFIDSLSLDYNIYDNAFYLGTESNPYFALIKAKNTKIETCEINENCVVIANNAFAKCNSLTSITIPNSVESIGEYAFSGCTSLTFAKLGCGLKNIGVGAFYECMSISSIVIPDSVTFIGENGFYYCISLSNVYYKGTQHEWENNLDIKLGNEYLTNASIFFYSELEPIELGNYWHYVDGVPTIW